MSRQTSTTPAPLRDSAAQRPRSGWPAPALVGCCLFVALALGCGGAADGAGPIPQGAPNVLLVTLDTTRADHLGAWGHAGARTPRLDGLAAGGVRFARAYSQVPLTLASHASMLSGVHPAGTGVHVNFQGAVAREVRLLPEAFQASGYRTAAFVAAWVLNSEFGLGRGFGRYDDLGDQRATLDKQVERSADVIVDHALEWLAQDPERPFFGWLHFFDAHDPYEPPEGFREGFDEAYDGELAFVDHELGRLLDWLDQKGLSERTLIVVAGDHGESLGEHGEGTHGLLVYDYALHVPLIVAQAGRWPAGRVVDEPVGLIDLHSTIVELCGGKVDWKVEGASLLDAIEGRPLAPRAVYAESEYPLRSFGWAPLRSLIVGEWKYIEAPEPELYDLLQDPGELEDRAASEPEVLARMRAALAEARGAQVRREVEAIEVAGEAAEVLGALGYMEGAAQVDSDVDIRQLKNPVRMTPVMRAVMRAKTSLDEHDFAQAATTLAPLLLESPESDEIWSMYAQALLETRRFAEAVDAARKSMRRQPEHSGRLTMLGDALMGVGQREEALRAYERALRSNPDNAQAHSRKGLAHAQAREWSQALTHFERHVELEPESANARTNLANVYFSVSRFEDGLRELEVALRLEPRCAPAHMGRVQALLATGRASEARAALQDALQALPSDVAFARALRETLSSMRASELVRTLDEHLRQLGG